MRTQVEVFKLAEFAPGQAPDPELIEFDAPRILVIPDEEQAIRAGTVFSEPTECVQDRVAAVIEPACYEHGPHPIESVVEKETVPHRFVEPLHLVFEVSE